MQRYEIIIYWSNEDQVFIAEAGEGTPALASVAPTVFMKVLRVTGFIDPPLRAA